MYTFYEFGHRIIHSMTFYILYNIYKVMVLSKFHDRNVFLKLSQMFAEMVWTNLYYVIVSQYCLCRVMQGRSIICMYRLYNKPFFKKKKKKSLKMVSFVLPQKRAIHWTRSFRQWSVWLCIMTFPKVCFIKIKHFWWVNSIWDRCINGSAYTSWILLSCSYLLCTWDTSFYRLLLFQLFQFFT